MTAAEPLSEAVRGTRQAAPPLKAEHDRSTALLAVFDAVLATRTLPAAAAALCTRLARVTGARRAATGWLDGPHLRLIGLSNSAEPRLPEDLTRAMQAAMTEAIDQAIVVDSHASGADAPITQMARRLAGMQEGARVLSVPIGRDGQALGALTLLFDAGHPAPTETTTLLVDAAYLAADLLPLIERDAISRWQRLLRASPRAPTAGAPAAAGRGRRWALAIGALVLALLWMPLPLSLSADARLEGAVQRVVAAPLNGYLKEVLVRPGDTVAEGQMLARLGERDLELERLRLASELSQRQGEKAVAQARADRAAMMIAAARIDEVQARIDLADQQLQRMAVTAPIDGTVIDGDLARSIGAPFERGQTLFTLAPADRYRVVVELDERDIGRAEVGQTGHVALSALPWETVPVVVRRVGASARVIDGRNVFEIEAEPRQDRAASKWLRPGLRGVARLDVPPTSLGERLATRIALASRRLLWRWWP